MRLELSGHGGTTVRAGGREYLYFGGCDYLGLGRHPAVIEAAASGLRDYGVSVGASRETTGHTREHARLEAALAAFLEVEAVLLLPDGYLTNLVVAQSLAHDHDAALVDEESHPSVLDGIASAGLRLVPYAHLDAHDAAARASDTAARLAWTDGVFPSTGRMPPIDGLLAALPPSGALVVDDAHALGVIGERGRGTVARVRDPRVVITGTLSKAFGCAGGLVATTSERVRQIRERSRAHIGTTALAPALARAAHAALAVHLREPDRLAALRRNIDLMRATLERAGLRVSASPLPVFVFAPPEGVTSDALAQDLLAAGIYAPSVRYLSAVTLRWTVSAAHSPCQIERLGEAVSRALGRR